MEEIDVFKSLRESVDGELAPIVDEREAARLKLIADHKAWLKKTKKEHPSPYQFFKVGVYIRYFNQTKYENYLDNHKMQFIDLIQSCPNWTLVDFYVDQGQNAPKMENAPEWCRLLDDCFNNKVDLIITHKVSNVSRDADELTFCARLLSARKHPVGMYFIGEDAYTGIMKYGQVPFQHTKQKSGMVVQFGLKKPTPICCLPRTGRYSI